MVDNVDRFRSDELFVCSLFKFVKIEFLFVLSLGSRFKDVFFIVKFKKLFLKIRKCFLRKLEKCFIF